MSDYMWVAVAAMLSAFAACCVLCGAGMWVLWQEYKDQSDGGGV